MTVSTILPQAQLSSHRLTSALELLWSGGDAVAIGKMLLGGAIICVMYSVLNVWVGGTYQDEVIVPAQIITGAVHYPAGHPHAIFYIQAYSLQNYLAAGFWAWVPNAFALSALRNILFLFLSIYVPFALTLQLTRRPFWGYLAAALTVSETSILLKGVYPLWVFPNAISQGHIGTQVALLIIVLLLAGQWWIGGILLGALPSIHPAMALAVYPWSILYLFKSNAGLRAQGWKRLFVGVSCGLAICLLLAGIIYIRSSNLTLPAPYNGQANGALIRQTFIAFTDVHRRPFSIESLGYLFNPLAFFAIGILLLWGTYRDQRKGLREPGHADIFWILLLGVIAWVIVYGAGILLELFGVLPVWMDVVMPFRFSNLTASIIIPLTVAGIAWSYHKMSERQRLGAMLLVIALAALEGILIVTNRIRAIDYLLFITWGLFLGLDLLVHWQDRAHRLLSVLAVLALGGVLVLLFHSTRQGVILLLTFLLSVGLVLLVDKLRWSRILLGQDRERQMSMILLGACVFAGIAGLVQYKVWDAWMSSYDHSGNRVPRWDVVSQSDRELIDWFAANTQPDEIVLPSLAPRIYLQAKTGHPVLFEQETLWLMTYMPSVASTVGTMTRDLFGIDYANPEQLKRLSADDSLPPDVPAWSAAWQTRTLGEWETLGKKYGFRLVLSSTPFPLNLPVAYHSSLWTVYRIP